ncbi:hypothetical protein Axi01nite_08290 [Actinoplanes xinjiangensis]|nr:hypothetical protein Axi01nite_08290 [Actinoplanes xinjiangensis]
MSYEELRQHAARIEELAALESLKKFGMRFVGGRSIPGEEHVDQPAGHFRSRGDVRPAVPRRRDARDRIRCDHRSGTRGAMTQSDIPAGADLDRTLITVHCDVDRSRPELSPGAPYN